MGVESKNVCFHSTWIGTWGSCLPIHKEQLIVAHLSEEPKPHAERL